MELNDKTILVTGASSGIGRATAVACAQKGARPIIHYRKNREGAEQTLQLVQEYSTGHIVQADLTAEMQVDAMFEEIAQHVNILDCLVNNAGEAHVGILDDFFENHIWHDQFDSIFFSALYTTQRFLKQHGEFVRRKIVFVSSVYGNPDAGKSTAFAYSTAKAALSSMAITLAKSFPSMRVNAVAPGYTWTPPWEGISDDEKEEFENRTLIGRFITPEEIAHTIIALLENDAITGQVVTVDGGLMLNQLERKKNP